MAAGYTNNIKYLLLPLLKVNTAIYNSSFLNQLWLKKGFALLSLRAQTILAWPIPEFP